MTEVSTNVLRFIHAEIRCGSHGRSTLQDSKCLCCSWRATGKSASVAIAEQAHRCRALRTLKPDGSSQFPVRSSQ
jgi:hypothetical protein